MTGIGLSTKIYDLNGSLFISGRSLDPGQTQQNNQRERRISRTATLDGGTSVYDTGYAPSDRDLSINVISPTPEIVAFFAHLVETYNEIIVTTEESAFRVVPQKFSIDRAGTAILSVGIIEDIGA